MKFSFHRRPWFLSVALLIGAFAVAAVARPAFAASADWVWLESEAFSAKSPATLAVGTKGWGRADVLSGSAWVSVTVNAADVDKAFPGDAGPTLDYAFTTAKSGAFDVWNRIGFEAIRSPIEWCIDNGPWTPIAPDAPTVDQADLQDWVPLGWLKMGAQSVTAGKHTLQIRVRKSADSKGKRADLHYASDAILLTDLPFHPNGALKPDQTDGASDTDRAAAAHVFAVLEPAGAAQAATPLRGDWQITADDEPAVDDRLGPIKATPDFTAYLWRAISLPGDRNVARPEMNYVHRYWLRTRVAAPVGIAGRACYLHLPAVNMSATLFVNGQFCGYTKNNFATWDCDVTRALRPGQTNEIAIGIKDAFYGSADPAWATHIAYLPMGFWHYNEGTQLDMPVLARFENGLLRTPSLMIAGATYTSDVFAMPSVGNRTLGLEITLHNPTNQPMTVSVANAVEPLEGGTAEKTFAPRKVTVLAASDTVVHVSDAWANPKLWWPDDPRQYVVVTRLSHNGKNIDERRTKFGFREWGWHGPNFTLNGIPWHGFEDATDLGSGEPFVEKYRAHHQTMHRMWGEPADLEDQLDFMDSHGVNVRRTGIFDGEGAAGLYDVTRPALWDNYREQLAAWIRSQRNHPSIFIWSIENEITFINGHVTGHDALTTAEHHKSGTTVLAVDPTRPWMVDGGNALLDESFPVYGGHYLDPPFTTLPAGAYDRAGFAHRQVWPITQAKPILLGETYYAAGDDLADFSTVYGDAAFVGKSEAKPAIGRIATMLSEGYRWNEINFDLYMSSDASTDDYYRAWSPVAVICRDWDWTFGSGQTVKRRLGIFNDTRSAAPITLTTVLVIGGKTVRRESSVHHIAPGQNEKFEISLILPTVTARREGQWSITLTAGGKTVFTDTKPLAVLNPAAASGSVAGLHPAVLRSGAIGPIAVYDPAGAVTAFLRARHVTFQTVVSLSALPQAAKVLVIGKDALTDRNSASSALAAWASGGRVAVVLDQSEPLRYQGLPGPMATTTDQGSIAFIETPDSPLFADLRQEDFLTWPGAGPLYRNAYGKPTAGGQSLVQCDHGLQDTALAEMPTGTGLLLLSQLTIEDHLAQSVVAQKLLLNLIRFAGAYRPVVRPVSVAAAEGSPLRRAVAASGLVFSAVDLPAAALAKAGSVAVITASPANLHALAADSAAVDRFTRSGGWLVLNGLTPDGLANYNRLVGFEHMIRPYRQEKVSFPRRRSPLTAGLSASSIVLGSGKRIFDFAAGEYPDPEGFGYVVDIDEVAPFATSTFWAYDKITDNYTMADGFWPLIINFPVSRDGSPFSIPITLPKPQTLTRFTYVQDLNYAATKKISLVFGPNDRLSFDLPPNGEPQTFEITPPRTAKTVTVEIDAWDHDLAKQHDGQDLVGVDNIYLYARRPADFAARVRPMTNIGALVEYPRGAGGILLCNVNFKESESVPENAIKKQTILATILRNLNAPFSSKSIVAGAANLTYSPVDLSTKANQFTGDQGWFGDKAHSFADLPGGRQTLAGVPYTLYRFTTSQTPTVVMLGGGDVPGNLPDHVTGILVGRKADALFFLQAARLDQPRSANDIRANRHFEIADYVVHYADGTTAKAPIYAGESVDSYVQTAPTAVPGAQIAWSRPYGDGKSAVAYTMQWNNPYPEKSIDTVDLVYGPDRRGVPALLALTAATAH